MCLHRKKLFSYLCLCTLVHHSSFDSTSVSASFCLSLLYALMPICEELSASLCIQYRPNSLNMYIHFKQYMLGAIGLIIRTLLKLLPAVLYLLLSYVWNILFVSLSYFVSHRKHLTCCCHGTMGKHNKNRIQPEHRWITITEVQHFQPCLQFLLYLLVCLYPHSFILFYWDRHCILM